MDLDALCQLAMEAAKSAGRLITTYRNTDFTIRHKDVGNSEASQVVTEVDHKAQAAIIGILQSSCDQYNLALLAEESTDNGQRQHKPAFLCVDPMDGTLSFVNNTHGYAVSIALVAQTGKPLLGVVYDPVEDHLYHAIDGLGAYKNGEPLHIQTMNPEQALILQVDPGFKQHPWFEITQQGLEQIAQQLGINGARIQYKAGAVMNACYVLETANSCYFKYPRSGNSGGSLWDYAATACLFKEAGAIACDIYGMPMELNRKGNTFMNHRGILYASNPQLATAIVALHQRLQRNMG